jgi:hypothetical protein
MATKEPKASTVNTELIVYRLDEIKEELASFKREYVTKAESAELRMEIKQLSKDLGAYREETTDELITLKKRNNFLSWAYPTGTAILTAILTYLIIEYFKSAR